MIQLPVFHPRLVRRRSATVRATLSLTAVAAHKVLGRKKVRVLLETFCSYSLHRPLMLRAGSMTSNCTTVRQGEQEANIIPAKDGAEVKPTEARRELSKPQNAKIIITDGDTPQLNTLTQ